MINTKELRKTFADPDFSYEYKSLVIELLDALEDANKRLEETEVKLRKGEECGLGPYTLVPNDMFTKMTKALEAADRLLVVMDSFDTSGDDVISALAEYRTARGEK